MPITINQVTDMLDDVDLCYYQSPKRENQVLVPFPMEDGVVNIFLDLQQDGAILKFRAPGLFMAEDPDTKSRLMEALLSMNFHWQLVKFSMDPTDGEVMLEVDLLVGENTVLHENQFHWCMGAITSILRDHLRELKYILYGIKPADPDIDSDDIEQYPADPTQPSATDIDEMVKKLLGDAPGENNSASDEEQPGISELGRFIDEECEIAPSDAASTDGTTLFSAYTNWSERNGGLHLSRRDFNRLIRQMGFVSRNRNREFLGIQLRSSAQA